jgi:SAM-dependent methyltransferase
MIDLRKLFFKFAWDTRCRNIDVRRVLARFPGALILDAGCGEYGLAAFMPRADITSVDILPAESVDARLKYQHGSILGLSFEKGSFDVAVSVDVLEHLPENLRTKAVDELVRVARRAVVIACPAGRAAREMDERFAGKLTAAGDPLPDWLKEHLQQAYPETDAIIEAIESAAVKTGRKTAISVSFSEPLSVAQFLRTWSLSSKYGYLAANLLAGIFQPLMPRAAVEEAYRSIILAEFSDA